MGIPCARRAGDCPPYPQPCLTLPRGPGVGRRVPSPPRAWLAPPRTRDARTLRSWSLESRLSCFSLHDRRLLRHPPPPKPHEPALQSSLPPVIRHESVCLHCRSFRRSMLFPPSKPFRRREVPAEHMQKSSGRRNGYTIFGGKVDFPWAEKKTPPALPRPADIGKQLKQLERQLPTTCLPGPGGYPRSPFFSNSPLKNCFGLFSSCLELSGEELVFSFGQSGVGQRVPSTPETGTCKRMSWVMRMQFSRDLGKHASAHFRRRPPV